MSEVFDETIGKLLATDPFVEAEKITGESYKKDKTTELLGIIGHIANCKDKDAVLSLSGDTTHSNTVERYLRVVTGIGFQEVYREPFHSDYWKEDETYYVLWRDDGILLEFDTFGPNVNSGKFYYQWMPTGSEFYGPFLSSGGYCKPPGWKEGDRFVWTGDHDCREAIKYHIRQLEEHGKFLCPWPVPARLPHLIHYEEWRRWKEISVEQLSADRIAKLPERVRRGIGQC